MKILKKSFNEIVEAVITECYVVMPEGIVDENGDRRYCKLENAVWDTGATNSIISRDVVDALGLKPTGRSSISSFAGIVDTDVYTIDLCFENGYRIEGVEVMCGDYIDYDMLIGIDVVNQGEIFVSTFGGKTTFYFRMPAVGKMIEE